MLAASIDEKIRPGPRLRPATKNRCCCGRSAPSRGRGRRRDGVDDEQREVKVHDGRSVAHDVEVIIGSAPAPCRARARTAGRQTCRLGRGADDGFRQRLGGERADHRERSRLPVQRPVASENTVSPSPTVCDGGIARARPSSAISATRFDLVLVSRGVGGDERDRRVLARRGAAASVSAPERSSCAHRRALAVGVPHAGDDRAGRGIDDVADGVDRDDRGDDQAVGQRDGCRCRCRPSSRARGPADLADRGAGAGADVAFRTGPSLRRAPRGSRSRRSAGSSGCRRSRGRRGSRPARSARRRPRRRASRCCALRDSAPTPCAASRPKALPPESTIALTLSTMLSGSSRSVSRVPGAPPRCETPPTAPSPSTRTTVQPVGRSVSVWWPTLMPVDRGQASAGNRIPCRDG